MFTTAKSTNQTTFLLKTSNLSLSLFLSYYLSLPLFIIRYFLLFNRPYKKQVAAVAELSRYLVILLLAD